MQKIMNVQYITINSDVCTKPLMLMEYIVNKSKSSGWIPIGSIVINVTELCTQYKQKLIKYAD